MLLVMGYLYQQHAPGALAVPAFWSHDGYDMGIYLTAWTPPWKDIELRNFPPDRCNDQADDAYVPPASGILFGMVIVFLYLFGTYWGVTITFIMHLH